MLSIPDLAELLGVSDKTIRRLIAGNKLPFHRVGNQIRFTDDQIAIFLATTGQRNSSDRK